MPVDQEKLLKDRARVLYCTLSVLDVNLKEKSEISHDDLMQLALEVRHHLFLQTDRSVERRLLRILDKAFSINGYEEGAFFNFCISGGSDFQ